MICFWNFNFFLHYFGISYDFFVEFHISWCKPENQLVVPIRVFAKKVKFMINMTQIYNKYDQIYNKYDTSKPHLQGFFALKKATRITELVKLLSGNPHLEPCKGDEASNVNYCSKGGDVVSYGFPKPIKIISTLHEWQQQI